MPPLKSSKLLDKLSSCNDDQCIERLVEEYLYSLIKNNNNSRAETLEPSFKLFSDDEIDENDEKLISNSMKFSEELIRKTLLIDDDSIDLVMIINDLEQKLGKTHPVVIFLKQLVEE
ncbi:MAG: hypothetical protein OWQ54_01340 [Sulfolobaceae archaeon]|nr:hypothetical protein [Sulfolobaceae archaeon]